MKTFYKILIIINFIAIIIISLFLIKFSGDIDYFYYSTMKQSVLTADLSDLVVKLIEK